MVNTIIALTFPSPNNGTKRAKIDSEGIEYITENSCNKKFSIDSNFTEIITNIIDNIREKNKVITVIYKCSNKGVKILSGYLSKYSIILNPSKFVLDF